MAERHARFDGVVSLRALDQHGLPEAYHGKDLVAVDRPVRDLNGTATKTAHAQYNTIDSRLPHNKVATIGTPDSTPVAPTPTHTPPQQCPSTTKSKITRRLRHAITTT